jgi:DHA1 family multidrug resistance protein-like MFS transporter
MRTKTPKDPPDPDTTDTSDGQQGIPNPLRAVRSVLLQGDRNLGRDAVGRFFHSPKGKISWRRNLYAIWAAQLLAIMGFSLRTPFLPLFFGDLGVDTRAGQALWTGIILSVGAAMMAITSPIWGAIADRKGRRPMLLRAQFASFVTIGLTAFVTAPWQILGLRVVEGALAGTVTAATALIAVTMPRERLGFGLGMIQTAVFSGSAIGPLAGGLLADNLGYRPTFVVASLMLLSAGFITLLVVQERFEPAERAEDDPKAASAWRLLLGPVLLSLTFAMLAIRFASSAVQPVIPLFVAQLSDGSGSTSSLAGITLGVLGLTSAVSSVYFGRLGDKRGHHLILIGAALGAGLIYLPMSAAQNPWQLIVLQAIFGVFAGGMIPAANALIASVTDPGRRGTVFGLMNTAASLGGFLGPLAGAGLAASIGFRATFLATGFVLLAMVAMLYVTGKKHPMEPAQDAAQAHT